MSREEWGEKINSFFPEKPEDEPDMPEWFAERIGNNIPDLVKVLMASDKLPEEAKMEAKRRIKTWIDRRIMGCYNNKWGQKEKKDMMKMKEMMEKLKEKMGGMDWMMKEDEDEKMIPEDWMSTRDWPMAGDMEERMRRLEMITMVE